MASIAYDIPLTAQPDIQNLENTQIEDTIIPKIPTHEPFLKGTVLKCQTHLDQHTTQTTDSQKAGNEIATDPSSAEGQVDANNQAQDLMKMFLVYHREGLATIRASNGVGCQVAEIFQKNFQVLLMI